MSFLIQNVGPLVGLQASHALPNDVLLLYSASVDVPPAIQPGIPRACQPLRLRSSQGPFSLSPTHIISIVWILLKIIPST